MTTDVLLTHDTHKIYESFKRTNDLALAKKILTLFGVGNNAYNHIFKKENMKKKQLYFKRIIL